MYVSQQRRCQLDNYLPESSSTYLTLQRLPLQNEHLYVSEISIPHTTQVDYKFVVDKNPQIIVSKVLKGLSTSVSKACLQLKSEVKVSVIYIVSKASSIQWKEVIVHISIDFRITRALCTNSVIKCDVDSKRYVCI
jgi:hypothetical protein